MLTTSDNCVIISDIDYIILRGLGVNGSIDASYKTIPKGVCVIYEIFSGQDFQVHNWFLSFVYRTPHKYREYRGVTLTLW